MAITKSLHKVLAALPGNSRLIIILYCSILLPACQANQGQPATKNDSTGSKKETQTVHAENEPGIRFDNHQAFEVISLERIPFTTSFITNSAECRDWNISADAFIKIVANAKPISGTEQDLAFANHSCSILGKVKQQGQYFEIELNAGAWLTIRCRDTTYLLGDFNKKDAHFFLSVPDEN